jgi:hypothetical protein
MYWNATAKKKWSTENHFYIRLTSDTDIAVSPWEYFLGFYRMYHVSGSQVEDRVLHHLIPSFDDL